MVRIVTTMSKSLPRILVLASGSETGGGSGFEKLVESSKPGGDLSAEIVGVVSNHEHGGVRHRADKLGVSFFHFPSPFTAERYQHLVAETGAEWIACSGWLKLVRGLDPTRTFNIHPGPLPDFGGQGMYGHYVHEAVMAAFKDGQVASSTVTMHFVTNQYDRGPTFFEFSVPIDPQDTAESLGSRVNFAEHLWQPLITSLVVNGNIHWDGHSEVVVPDWYRRERYCPERLQVI